MWSAPFTSTSWDSKSVQTFVKMTLRRLFLGRWFKELAGNSRQSGSYAQSAYGVTFQIGTLPIISRKPGRRSQRSMVDASADGTLEAK
jgi:hypothetical protein